MQSDLKRALELAEKLYSARCEVFGTDSPEAKKTLKFLNEIKAKYGPDTIMGTGSARGPGNEANYLMQKFMRACIGTNNVDHCARI